MSNASRIPIVGIGDDGLDGLTSAARQLIAEGQLLVGSDHVLSMVSQFKGEKFVVGADLVRLGINSKKSK